MPINTQPKILVVGGAGYIGSHMVQCLQEAGLTPLVLDNLSTGHQEAIGQAEFIIGDMRDTVLLKKLFATHHITAVMHFAAFIQVGESVTDPAKYYENNLVGTIHLLQAMRAAKVNYFIFSSTAAVYGEPQYTPIDEKHPLAPVNPYGRGKWMVEQILQEYAASYGLQFAILRYFNAAGASAAGHLCERHEPETHLIPLVLQVASGERESITVYGKDYPTIDGTCLRDYIHVQDLCDAHLLALKALEQGKKQCIYNLGTGQGYTVQQVIDTAKQVTQRDIPVTQGSRRAGDPAILVADASLAQQELGWKPKHSNLQTIIEHVWKKHDRLGTCAQQTVVGHICPTYKNIKSRNTMKLHHRLANLLGYDLIRKNKSHHTLDLHLQKIIQSKTITTIIDVGANKGQFALKLRQLGFKGKILSFEPVQREFDCIKALSKTDPLWQVHHCAMGSEPGVIELNVTDSTDLSSFLKPNEFCKTYYKDKVSSIQKQEAEVKVLKDFISNNNLMSESVLLKTDTQGFDLEVLKGVGDYLTSLIKAVVVELSFKPIYEGMPTALETMTFLKERGFDPSGLYQVSRDKKTLELIEIDGVFLNKNI